MARWGMPSSQRALMDATRKRAQKLEARGKPADFKELLPDGAGQRHHEHPQREHASKKPTRTVTNLVVPRQSSFALRGAAFGAPPAARPSAPPQAYERLSALELRVDLRKLLGEILDKRRRKQDRPHRERSVLEGSAGYLHEGMLIFWIREDPHTVGDLRGIDGIGNCRNSAGLDLLPERGGGYDLHRLNPPIVPAVRDVHQRLAVVFEIEDDREGQSVVAGYRVRNVRDIQFKHRLGPFHLSSRSKLSRPAQRELDWYEAPWSD